ncbi:MAG: Crp/Fnr family transcriptional regulator [Caldilineaceae bacterium]|nr:Crp/Fnr family transcriptional regulator [Caldilineaceae bacterium]
MERPSTDTLAGCLGRFPAFQGLDPDDLAKLAERAHWQEYAQGAIIFLEGDMAPGLFHLHAGWLKIVKLSPDGREQILDVIGPGEIFNYLGVFASRPNPATAIALEPAGVFLLRRDGVQRLLAKHPQIALRVVEAMADRLIELTQMVADLSLHTVEARLARLLLDRAEGDVVYRRRWTTQAEMAARLGTVPDVLSRVLRGLVEAGIVQVERQQIQILDRPGLAERAMVDVE